MQFCVALQLQKVNACFDLMQHSTSSRCCCSQRGVLDQLVQDVMKMRLRLLRGDCLSGNLVTRHYSGWTRTQRLRELSSGTTETLRAA